MFIQLLPLKVQLRCNLPKCFPAEILNRSQTRVGTWGWCVLSSKIWANSTAQYPRKSLGNLKNEKVSVSSGFNILPIYCSLFEFLRRTRKKKSPNAFLLYVLFCFCAIRMMHNVLNVNSNVNKMRELSNLSINSCVCTQTPVPCGLPV